MFVNELLEWFWTSIDLHGFSMVLFNLFLHGENQEYCISNSTIHSHETTPHTGPNDGKDDGGRNRTGNVLILG